MTFKSFVVVAVVLVGGSATSGAAPVPSAPAVAESAVLSLSVTQVQDGTLLRGTTLSCPATGAPGHPDAALACAQLVASGGDFDKLPVSGDACTLQYAPVDAHATGMFDGRMVDWHKRFGSLCTAENATGDVFRF